MEAKVAIPMWKVVEVMNRKVAMDTRAITKGIMMQVATPTKETNMGLKAKEDILQPKGDILKPKGGMLGPQRGMIQ